MQEIIQLTRQEKADNLLFDACMLHGFIHTYLKEGAIEISKEELVVWLSKWGVQYGAYIKEFSKEQRYT